MLLKVDPKDKHHASLCRVDTCTHGLLLCNCVALPESNARIRFSSPSSLHRYSALVHGAFGLPLIYFAFCLLAHVTKMRTGRLLGKAKVSTNDTLSTRTLKENMTIHMLITHLTALLRTSEPETFEITKGFTCSWLTSAPIWV